MLYGLRNTKVSNLMLLDSIKCKFQLITLEIVKMQKDATLFFDGTAAKVGKSTYSLLRNTSCAIIMIAIFPQDNLKYNIYSRYLQNQIRY